MRIPARNSDPGDGWTICARDGVHRAGRLVRYRRFELETRAELRSRARLIA